MTNGHTGELTCAATLAALARGGADLSWDAVERHLAGCTDCSEQVTRGATTSQKEAGAASGVAANGASAAG